MSVSIACRQATLSPSCPAFRHFNHWPIEAGGAFVAEGIFRPLLAGCLLKDGAACLSPRKSTTSLWDLPANPPDE